MSCEMCNEIESKGYAKAEDIHILNGEIHCLHCGCKIYPYPNRWDSYFHKICKAIASKSPCLSRQIGAMLVRDKSIISTGYNGPARGVPHCKGITEGSAAGFSKSFDDFHTANFYEETKLVCPRHAKGSMSGENLLECPAVHAEANCVANAARIGASTIGTTLYINSIIPCKDCSSLLVNAGVVEIVVNELKYYHDKSKQILESGNVIVRVFNIREKEDEGR